jgi:hypothetical protein
MPHLQSHISQCRYSLQQGQIQPLQRQLQTAMETHPQLQHLQNQIQQLTILQVLELLEQPIHSNGLAHLLKRTCVPWFCVQSDYQQLTFVQRQMKQRVLDVHAMSAQLRQNLNRVIDPQSAAKITMFIDEQHCAAQV